MFSSSDSNLESGEDCEKKNRRGVTNDGVLGGSKDPVGMLLSDDENVGMTVTIGNAEELDMVAASSAGSEKINEGSGEVAKKRGRGRPRKSDGPAVQVRWVWCGDLDKWNGHNQIAGGIVLECLEKIFFKSFTFFPFQIFSLLHGYFHIIFKNKLS